MGSAMFEIERIFQEILTNRLPEFRPEVVAKNPHEPAVLCRYYRLLFEYVRVTNAKTAMETGTFRGASALHLASGAPEIRVLTVDCDPEAKKRVDALKRPNIDAVVSRSVDIVEYVREKYAPLDVLFLDSDHTYETVSEEWKTYRPLLKVGGAAFFDDIHMNPGMDRFWNEITDPKIDISQLHVKGFGAAVRKD